MTCCSKWLRLVLWSVVAAAASVGTAGASEKGTLAVKDNGSVFTSEGIRKAEDAFEAVTFQAPTKLVVVTFGKVPDGKRAAFEAAKGDARKRFFHDWAEEVARSSGKPDVLVFISMEGSHIRAIDDRRTDMKRQFDDKDLHALEQKFVAGFEKSAGATDAAAKLARHDAGLLEGVNFVAEQLKDTTLPANQNGRRANAPANAAETKGTSVMSYVCIGIVALLAIWLVIGVVRMMMGGGGGGGNYGGGGMGGGGGGMGAGGGLMTGLLGGMLGAVAGNYLYNNFMGGNSHSNDSMGSSGGGYGDSGTSGDTGAGDYSGGGDGGGSDFGGDSGGTGDSGGGDFGGADSGGSDFGGGGSDFGGGGDSGGGDW